jgi:AraC-like DNA-binding protein
MNKPFAKQEQAKAWQLPALENLEVLHATYRTHTFARHVHEEFCLGIIVGGVEAVRYRGTTHIAPTGSLVVFQPDEGHSNWAATAAGWSFQVIYPAIDLLQRAIGAEETTIAMPFFADPIIADRSLFCQISQFHAQLAHPQTTIQLEQESQLLAILQTLVTRHAVWHKPNQFTIGREHRAVKQIKDYLQVYYAQDPSLEDLSTVCGLSPFHLARVFRKATGLPPHAYLISLRIAHAKIHLCQNRSLAEIAIDLGFTDQSHFTHTFKAWVGIPPGQYRTQIKSG